MINNKVLNELNNCFLYKKINDNHSQIITRAKYPNNKYIALALEKKDDKILISDKKQTLKFMNAIYELNAPDVISCINNVTKIYGFHIKSGELICELNDEKELITKIFHFIMCISQLINMFVFFDAPDVKK